VEFSVLWFGLLKMVVLVLVVWMAYNAVIKHELKSGLWNTVVAIAVLIAGILMQVKIDGTTSKAYTAKQERSIERTKEVPEKVVAKDWKKISTEGISKDDLK